MDDMRVAVSTNETIHSSPDHPAFILKPLDITASLSSPSATSTSSGDIDPVVCLDMYLDNIIANVPELALALHAKGFVRGLEFVYTRDIPYLNSSTLIEPYINPARSRQTMSRLRDIQKLQLIEMDHHFHHSIKSNDMNPIIHSFDPNPHLLTNLIRPSQILSTTHEINPKLSEKESKSWNTYTQAPPIYSDPKGRSYTYHDTHQTRPIFDPQAIDVDAAAIMRFLKENCREENGTYILRRQKDSHTLELYDVTQAAQSRQKQFMWMLAMLSYRFAGKLSQHTQHATATGKIRIRSRQMSLLRSCCDLLEEIANLGGDQHGTVRAVIFEQMADVHLSRIDEFSSANTRTQQKRPLSTGATISNVDIPGERGHGSPDNPSDKKRSMSNGTQQNRQNTVDEDDYDEQSELTEAINYLNRSIICLESMIREELKNCLDTQVDSNHKNSDNKDESDEDSYDSEVASTSYFIIESLIAQMAGALHKLIQASVILVDSMISSSKSVKAVRTLIRIESSFKCWNELRNALWLCNDKNNKQEDSGRQSSTQSSLLLDADMTILNNIPLLWDVLGEVCREVFRNAALVLIQEDQMFYNLKSLVNTWSGMTHSVLNIHKKDVYPVVNVITNETKNGKSLSRSQQRRRARDKKRKSLNCETKISQTITDRSVLFPSSSFSVHSWSVSIIESDLLNSLSPSPATAGLPDKAKHVLPLLSSLHSLIGPVVLDDSSSILLPLNRDSDQGTSISLLVSEDTQLLIQVVYCFLTSTILYNYLARRGKPALAFHNQSASSKVPKFGDTIVLSNSCVREGIRRLADSCNTLGRHLVTSSRPRNTPGSTDVTDGDRIEFPVDQAIQTLQVAEFIFIASAYLFEIVDDYYNSAVIRCNLSGCIRNQSLLRLSNLNLTIDEDRIKGKYCLERMEVGIRYCQTISTRTDGHETAGLQNALDIETANSYISIGK
jgi:hypothetical protein